MKFILSRLSGLILSFWGFQYKGSFPHDIAKKVVIFAPHSSNWDFVIGMLYKYKHNVKTNFLGKASLFYRPWGWFFTMLGGAPVSKRKKQDLVSQVVQLFNEREKFTIALSPEGTRERVERFKSGFYHIAHQAGVPIIKARFDYKNKIIEIDEPFYPTGDAKKDISIIEEYYRGTVGVIAAQSFL